jgi:hypothetical protein
MEEQLYEIQVNFATRQAVVDMVEHAVNHQAITTPSLTLIVTGEIGKEDLIDGSDGINSLPEYVFETDEKRGCGNVYIVGLGWIKQR